MQNDVPVKLGQVRDLGQVISTTFLFLKQNWRPLFRAIAVMCLPLALIGGAISGRATVAAQEMNFAPKNDPMAVFSKLGSTMFEMIPGYILLIVASTLMIAIVHEYLRAYHLGEHHGMTTGMLWDRMKSELGTYFAAGFIVTLAMIISFILCFFPGLYVWPILSLTFVVHAIERTGTFRAMGRSYELVSKDFWPTLGLVLVISLVYYVITMIVQIPSLIVGVVVGVNTGLEAAKSGADGLHFPPWFTIFSSISTAIQWCVIILAYPILLVGMGLKYFSLLEVHEGHGLRKKLDDFGQA